MTSGFFKISKTNLLIINNLKMTILRNCTFSGAFLGGQFSKTFFHSNSMKMINSVQGRIDHINPVEFVNARNGQAPKQTFILDITQDLNNKTFVMLELFGDEKVSLLKTLAVGDMVDCRLNFRGNKYQKDHLLTVVYPNFQVWRIDKIVRQGISSADPAAQAFEAEAMHRTTEAKF